MNGAQVLIKTLEKLGVKKIFGYPGGQSLPIYDALIDAKLEHILVRHEQVAAHAADAYARVSGKVGVCMATSGPGATNLVTGIANAYMDSIPIVAITGQVPTPVIGTDAFQEADITGITLPIVKHSYLVKDANDLSRIVKEAFYIASTGRPGPVLIDMPRDVSQQQVEYKEHQIELPGYKPTTKGHAKQIKQAARAILCASAPVMYVGGGAISSNASEEVTKLAKMLKIPVANTLMAKGIFDEYDDLSLGMLGMHGTVYANYAITNSDLVIAVGARFDDRVTGKISAFAPKSSVVHIDVDPAEISKNVAAKIPIVGDVKTVLKSLIQQVKDEKKSIKPKDTSAWLKQIADWKKEYPLTYKKDKKSIKPQYVLEVINKLTKNKRTIVATGVGQHQMFTALYYKNTKPRRFVTSGGLGTMGFGLPAAIGAQVADPQSLVIDVDGDGSFQMVSQDLATAVVNELPINIIILNNGYLGMVRQWQQLFYDVRYSHVNLKVGSPDYVKLAEAYGAVGLRVSKPEEVEPALKKAFNSKKVCVIDILVEREENVFPMVAPGAPINDILMCEE